jgi:hypothetical protein
MVDIHFCSKQYCIFNSKAHLVARCHGWKILWLGATTPPLFVISFSIGPKMELSGIKKAQKLG